MKWYHLHIHSFEKHTWVLQIAKKEKLRKIVQNKGTFCGLIKKSGVMPFENIKLKLLMTFLLSTILSWYQADIKAINSSRLILIFAEHKKSCNFLWCSPLSTCCLLLPFSTESPYSNWHFFYWNIGMHKKCNRKEDTNLIWSNIKTSLV